MITNHRLVGMMAITATAVAGIVYLFTESIKWSLGIAGICFALDLTFAPWIRKKMNELNQHHD